MPLRLDVKELMRTHSDRAKTVDLHPTQSWVLSGLYCGKLTIHDYQTQALVKTIEVSQLPLRCAKFITRKEWIIVGGDDTHIYVYNYNTVEKLKSFVAHSDYIRYISVHPVHPHVLTSSDDTTIKLWNWEADWQCMKTFESHTHYVMMCQWNPKDSNIFASASLDRTIRVWGAQSSSASSVGAPSVVKSPHFALLGHENGVNCIEYSPSGDRPYLVSGSDDKTIRVWDYQTKQCVQCITGHSKNVVCTSFHPHLPIIISGSEDCTIKIWHSTTFRLEKSFSFMMERAWSFTSLKGSNTIALAFDLGTYVIKLGNETPIASMHGSKIFWVRGSEVLTSNLQLLDISSYGDGDRIPVSMKLLGNCEMFPQSISHHANGRFIAFCDDTDYIVYTHQALRNKTFGKALDFVWSPTGSYATRSVSGRITLFYQFQEYESFQPPYNVDELFGGQLIGLRTQDFIYFYEWQTCRLVRRIDVAPSFVWWSESGSYVALACAESFFLLRHDQAAVAAAIAGGEAENDDGIKIAFELIEEVNEKVETACWVSDCFVFITASLRLQTICAGRTETIAFLDRPMYILGFYAEQNRIYLMERDFSFYSYQLNTHFIHYQVQISRKDFDTAEKTLRWIPPSLHGKVARFLESQGLIEMALALAPDPDHQFDLAYSLNKLEYCYNIVKASESPQSASTINKWKQLGDKALETGEFKVAIESYQNAKDYSGLFLIFSAIGDSENLRETGEGAAKAGKRNVAFQSFLLLQDIDRCIELLLEWDYLPEAAFFALTYSPSRINSIVELWQQQIAKVNPRIAETFLFFSEETDPNYKLGLELEKSLRGFYKQSGKMPASEFRKTHQALENDIFEFAKSEGSVQATKFLKDKVFMLNESKLAAADSNSPSLSGQTGSSELLKDGASNPSSANLSHASIPEVVENGGTIRAGELTTMEG